MRGSAGLSAQRTRPPRKRRGARERAGRMPAIPGSASARGGRAERVTCMLSDPCLGRPGQNGFSRGREVGTARGKELRQAAVRRRQCSVRPSGHGLDIAAMRFPRFVERAPDVRPRRPQAPDVQLQYLQRCLDPASRDSGLRACLFVRLYQSIRANPRQGRQCRQGSGIHEIRVRVSTLRLPATRSRSGGKRSPLGILARLRVVGRTAAAARDQIRGVEASRLPLRGMA